MIVDGYEFEHVTDEAPVRLVDKVIQALMPQSRHTNSRRLLLKSYGTRPFCELRGPQDTGKAGFTSWLPGRTFGMRACEPTYRLVSILGMATYRQIPDIRTGKGRMTPE